MVDRLKFIKEMQEKEQLRPYVRKKVQEFFSHKNGERKQEILEEQQLRSVIRQIIKEGRMLPAPHPSTGVNMLIDLLKKVVPIIKADYRLLTTNQDQRKSYRAHLVANLSKTLERQDLQDTASSQAAAGEHPAGAQAPAPEGVPTNVPGAGQELTEADPTMQAAALAPAPAAKGDADPSKFLDIEEPKKTDKLPGEDKKSEEDKKKDFTLAGHDLTGRNRAYTTFQKIESDISTSYSELSAKVDKDVFRDYLITNVKLHLDQAEGEMQPDIQEPTTQQYEKEKGTV